MGKLFRFYIFFNCHHNQILEAFHPCKYCKVFLTTLMREKILNRYTVYLVELVDLIPAQWRWGCCWPRLGEQSPESLVPPQVPAAPQGQTLEHLQIQTNRLTTEYRVIFTLWGFFCCWPFTLVLYYVGCLIQQDMNVFLLLILGAKGGVNKMGLNISP